MRKSLATAILFLAGLASAAPLVGSSASVFDSNFCRTYKCQHVSTQVVTNPYLNTSDTKVYKYLLPGNVELNVSRFIPTGQITDAYLTLRGTYGKVERDAYNYTDMTTAFLRDFGGLNKRTSFGVLCDTQKALYDPNGVRGGFIAQSPTTIFKECQPNPNGKSAYSIQIM